MLVLFVVSRLPKVVVGIAVVKLTCGLFVTVEIFVAREGKAVEVVEATLAVALYFPLGVEGLTVLSE